MIDFPNSEKICRIEDPVNWEMEKMDSFVQACREMALFHKKSCPEINFVYKRHDFDPECIVAEGDIELIPPIGVTAMKYHLLLSRPPGEAALKLTSSGTKGQKTQIWFDEKSLERVQAMLGGLWKQEGLVSDKKTNYMMMVYDPEEAKDLGIAFSIRNQQRFAPEAQTYFSIRKDLNGNWEFNSKKAISKLEEFISEKKPVRIHGITSFIYELIEELLKVGGVKLPPNSFLLTGGGWKAADDKKTSREYFRERAEMAFGIPSENIRDGYGMAEHSAPYIECKRHRFHVPVYNRVVVRDPESMVMLPPGKIGLLELVTPFNAMMPNLAVLSTDLGYIDPEVCPCGWNSPTFTIVGRGGISKHKGCALTASEIVRRKQ
ncbi:MAG: hypothetical protein HQM08_27825 [Candidatus Riflebacteria bacterium]|nr:hypothetical protein [Candidatus Riflebacteria bacterium]